ncbi:MAG TPA: integrin alpha, partial [Planctomycetota bacterium]|nr:integrin alpha [Planctomycetota bacterium]
MKCPNLSPWLLLLGFTAPLFGQTLPPLVASAGIAPGERRGSAVADAGDLDADGIADFWVGSPFDSTIGFQAGAVRAISGADGGVLATCFGSAAVDHFGWAIAAFPDVNGDGVRDLAIGAPDSDVQAQNGGAVRVLSGANGGLLFTVAGSSSNSAFGFSVAAAGDVNGDGTQDFSVGAPFDAFGGTDAGAVFTYSGVNGAVLAHHPGSSGDRLGIAVAGAGDVDGDNRADILGGADQDASGTGRVHLWSGRTGALLRTLVGTDAGGHFGGALAGGFDATGDGVPDVAVGANAALRHGQPSGAAWIFSGTSGAPCFEAFGEGAHESFGSALALVPDLDGDGRADLVVAAAVENGAAGGRGVVRAFGGSSRRLLRTWRGPSGGDRFGWALCVGSDRDGDNLPELIVGAPKDDSPLVDSGTVFVLSTRAAAPVPYCTAKPNSQGC